MSDAISDDSLNTDADATSAKTGDDPAMTEWWSGLTAEQQAEALTIPQKLPAWMSTGEKASEILANWPAGEQVPGEYLSEPLREFLENKRTS